MSTKDQQHWRVVRFIDNDAVGINGYFMVGENRATTGMGLAIHGWQEQVRPSS